MSGRTTVPVGRVHVIRDRDDDRVLPEEQPALEEEGALVVEDVLVPVVHHELGDDDSDRVVVPALVEIVEILLDGVDQLAVGRVHDLELDSEVEALPLPLELVGILIVMRDVNGDEMVRIE